ncbi:hypothetical protein [Polyangium mundeleinium]|uniref:Lipoprotein n=1 Tax=Polyangium mundeleinium TaxID=2995306 RepID=A0ABT5EFN0_9BACT|nr:hypothetical protein [Polyangium mundeleinium]MDC0740633.1 hypothetical protein [Polyangium mundeleinium]
MFERVSAGRRAIAAGAILSALAACGSEVETEATGAGGGGSASSGGTSVSSSSTGGSGGSGGLPAPTCAPGEAAIVAAVGWQSGQVIVHHEGKWTTPSYPMQGADRMTTYVDVYGHLGVFWTETSTDSALSHFMVTGDGTKFDLYDVEGWFPLVPSPVLTVGVSLLMGNAGEGSSLAHFDPDAYDWYPYPKLAPFELTSAVRTISEGSVLGVGLSNLNELCDAQVFWSDGGGWTEPHCRADVKVFMGNEIPVAPPQAVVLPNDDVVVVYHESYARIAATRFHDGVWSAPESISLEIQSLEPAITATPGGDVIVALPSTSGALSALRYVPGVGWGELVTIDPTASSTVSIGAAPGICGDDALIAYAGGGIDGEVRVARLRGETAEVSTIGSFTEQAPKNIRMTTRPGFSP